MGISAAAGALIVGGTAAQIDAAKSQKRASRRAERRQREANNIERARAQVQRSIARRRAISEQRAASAFNQAGAVAAGIGTDSSAVAGANAALGSNLATSLSSQNRSFVSGQASFDLRQAAAFDVANANANAALKSLYGSTATQLGFAALGSVGGGAPSQSAPQPVNPTPRPSSAVGFPF